MSIPLIVAILVIILFIFYVKERGGVAVALNLTAGQPEDKENGMSDPLVLVMNDHQRLTLSINPTDVDGDPANVDGLPVWDLFEGAPELLNLFPSEDGLSCEVSANGTVGSGVVRCSADVDLGEGVVSIEEFANFTIVQSMATELGMTASAPEDIPVIDT